MKFHLRQAWRMFSLITLGLAMGMTPGDPPPPDQVEEDWQVVVANPDPVAVGPQITTCVNPTSDPRGAFATFYLNYEDYPTWNPGGMQLKAYGVAPDASTNPPVLDSARQGDGVCETEGETITWTQRMSVSGGNLNVNVVNGQSTTWGKFGQSGGSLGVSMSSTVTDLSGYKPDYSVSKSGVSWQSNRVVSMTLLQVRYFSGGKLVSTDSTPRNVDLTPGT
jgi:hypothetical protein